MGTKRRGLGKRIIYGTVEGKTLGGGHEGAVRKVKGKNFLRKGVARLKSHFPHLSIGGEGWELRAERHGPSILPVSVETRALVLRGCRSQLGCCGFPGCRRPCPGQGQLPASNLRDREKPGGQVRKERDSELCRDATAIPTVLEVPAGFPTGLR